MSLGSTLPSGVGLNLQASVTASAGNAKGFRSSPTLTAAVNGDILNNIITGGTLVGGSFTTLSYNGITVGTPTISTGSLSTAAMISISGAPAATTKYGIYQTGTDQNVFGGAVTVPNFTATGTTTLATSLTGYLSASSGVVSASSTIPTTALSGTITNAQLANSSITIAGTSTALGGSITQDTITGLSTTGLVKRTAANTLAIASSGTDYAPATSGTSLLYGNGSGGFSNATVSSTNLTFSSGTLNTIQNIATTSSPQFSSLGIGVAASGTAGDLYANSTFEVGTALIAGVGVNFQPSITASSGLAKGFRLSPALTAAANSDNLYTQIVGGTVTNSSFSGVGYQELTLGSPTISGTFATAYQLYLSGFSSGTLTSKYGIYQAGTEQNYFAGALNVASGSRGATNQNLTPATSTISASAIDWSVSNSFYKALSANTTFTFSNAVDGQVITICLLNTTSNYTVTWPTIKWAGGTAPTMTTGAHYDVYTIYYNATVGAYFGSYVQNF